MVGEKEMSETQKVIEFLEELHRKDPVALYLLQCAVIPINDGVAEMNVVHPHVSPHGQKFLNMLGLVNSVLRTLGQPSVKEKWSATPDSEGRYRLLGFEESK